MYHMCSPRIVWYCDLGPSGRLRVPQTRLFTTKRKAVDNINIRIDGHSIDRVKHTKFLGVFIDEKLNWKKHISYISGKIARGLGIIVKARKSLPFNALRTLYFSFIYPYFIYCNHVWGGAYETNLKPLVILQKRCVRIITMSEYYEHTDPLFAKLGLLKLHDINKYIISKFMYRWYHEELPIVFKDMFIPIINIHDHNTRQSKQLYFKTPQTNLGKTKCSYRAAYMWNILLRAKINPDTSEAVFAKSVKQCIKVGII